MVEVLAKVTLPSTTGLPADAVNMDMSFDAASIAPATLDGIAASIVSFYNTVYTGEAISRFIGDQISRTADAASIDFYDVSAELDGDPVGSPVHTVAWTVGAANASNNYPSEVACKVTILADGWEDVPETAIDPGPPIVRSRPRGRYRGGFYLGPLNDTAADNEATTEPRPGATFLATIDAAAFAFMDERGGDFAIWSRADAVMRLVAPGGRWTVDNAFDTIRKRGWAPTSRALVWP